MPIKFSIDKKILLLAGLAVFLLGFFVFAKEARAGCCYCGDINTNPNFCIKNVLNCDTCAEAQKTYDLNCNLCRPNSCCVKVLKLNNKVEQCVPGLFKEECEKVEPFTTTKGYYFDTSCSEVEDCKRIDEVYSGKLKKEPEKRIIKFIPNITLPGSITIGGKEIKFVAGEPTEVTGLTLGAWISLFYMFFCGVVGIFAVANIIFGGFKWLTSFGNASRISAAKERITSAVIGLFLTLGAFIILQTINPRLVEFRNLSINQIRTILQIESEVSSEKGAPPVSWDGGNVDTYDIQLLKAATLYQIDRDWLKALMLIESGGRPEVVSPAGACGLIQLLPSTAGMTCEELKNPDVNTMAAAKYYASLMKDTCPARATTKNGETVVCDLPTNCKDGASTYANAAYNGGLGANCSSHDKNCKNLTWWECENNKGFAETRAYVQKVKQAYDKIVDKGW